MTGNARDIDDAAASLRDHGGAEFLARQQDSANEIEIEIRLPGLLGNLFECALGTDGHFGIIAAGGIDKDAGSAQRIDQGAVSFAEAFFASRVNGEEAGLSALVENRFDASFAAEGV